MSAVSGSFPTVRPPIAVKEQDPLEARTAQVVERSLHGEADQIDRLMERVNDKAHDLSWDLFEMNADDLSSILDKAFGFAPSDEEWGDICSMERGLWPDCFGGDNGAKKLALALVSIKHSNAAVFTLAARSLGREDAENLGDALKQYSQIMQRLLDRRRSASPAPINE